ncbi:bifunctional diaminohydroxyphosphoribosylaminopyrimidine deaminase/5-amino-6-(5-phosphoribosylamino)uracil reductase RibD [Thermosediminibacter oceani]|uniref:Riboflavin biosynthesis protein RibD n=1 Tax=Thermosediminibacter oceani (strain ATCC BAA-1034 / DSM 16646 / JW/IW-1228P) TaxID=555079 RepID=D9RYK7_THEOJ|nr:bifunctional diaminohydroxyphosphoribosylaminopyrimidine deaminase/5-amino-6-(5-phosphoribosylamino)uracil reductase RibD [Thermosediminibacter oceani]ADL08431.1 diaminohydroxyphosphoribosylaminopyrimidine deaminase; 5-amino-6-(5-phosphoribosylamino)uracil reductase [Thermosediminibacter oceani DSM 16646]
MERDVFFMRRALDLAKKGRGTTSPNPMVGAVVVKDGEIVGEGYHRKAGEPHAEVEALAQAAERARGAELYVNLEPCCHYGRTPPCADTIIRAGVKRVVAAMADPNPLVAGKGIKRLKEAGIEVVVGVLEEEAKKLNEVFIKYIITGKPFVVAKIAQSFDGKIAMASGESRWITGEPARVKAHELRSWYDAIMVGVGTVMADDPLLTCRLPEKRKNPVRIVVDSGARMPPDARMLRCEGGRVILATTERADSERVSALKERGVEVIKVPPAEGRVDLSRLMEILGGMGITSVLVEGGSTLTSSLIKGNLVDKLLVFVAPVVIGGEGIDSVGKLHVDRLSQAPRFKFHSIDAIGGDLLLEAYPDLKREEDSCLPG